MERQLDDIVRQIIGAAINVHRYIGIGLPQRSYRACLLIELKELGLVYDEQVAANFQYKNHWVTLRKPIDLIVENSVVVHVLNTNFIQNEQVEAVRDELKHFNLSLGLLLNFNTKSMKGESIRRISNGSMEDSQRIDG